MAQYFHYTKCL